MCKIHIKINLKNKKPCLSVNSEIYDYRNYYHEKNYRKNS